MRWVRDGCWLPFNYEQLLHPCTLHFYVPKRRSDFLPYGVQNIYTCSEAYNPDKLRDDLISSPNVLPSDEKPRRDDPSAAADHLPQLVPEPQVHRHVTLLERHPEDLQQEPDRAAVLETSSVWTLSLWCRGSRPPLHLADTSPPLPPPGCPRHHHRHGVLLPLWFLEWRWRKLWWWLFS
ncbi:unnamed protein product [Linum trigynum]|uniref:Uncharacterized protein n=1 Tax=Linum trigynum TaxID=586398 RepID=A0AAV2DGL2_9ROSI